MYVTNTFEGIHFNIDLCLKEYKLKYDLRGLILPQIVSKMIINHCMTLRNPEEFILCKIVSFKRYAVGALGDNIENLGEHLNKTTRSFDLEAIVT